MRFVLQDMPSPDRTAMDGTHSTSGTGGVRMWALLFISSVFSVGGTSLAASGLRAAGVTSGNARFYGEMLALPAALLLIGFYEKRRLAWSWPELLMIRGIPREALLPLALLALGLVPCMSLVSNTVELLVPPDQYLDSFLGLVKLANSDVDVLLLYVSVGVVAPVYEEALVRGCILGGLLRRYSQGHAVLLSSLAFGVMHIIPSQAVMATFAGWVLGWVLIGTGSIWACIFVHAVWNNATTFLPVERLGFDWVSWGSYIAGLLLVYLAYRIGSALMGRSVVGRKAPAAAGRRRWPSVALTGVVGVALMLGARFGAQRVAGKSQWFRAKECAQNAPSPPEQEMRECTIACDLSRVRGGFEPVIPSRGEARGIETREVDKECVDGEWKVVASTPWSRCDAVCPPASLPGE